MNIIEQRDGFVDLIRPSEVDRCEAIAESTKPNGVPARSFSKSPSKQLKEEISFAAVVARDGHKLERKGKYLVCLCPFHEERTPSFIISEDDLTGRCYGCEWHGDIFDYEQKARKVGFFEALQRLERMREKVLRTTPLKLRERSRTPREEIKLTAVEQKLIGIALERARNDEWLCPYIASKRGWRTNTIQKLVQEGSVGWYRGALAFIYPSGMKLRDWPHKWFVWEFGCQSIWREDRIETAQHIYITEGETDTISLVDTGIEEDPGVAVVCVPGASAFQKEWAPMFTGKTVTLCFDNDAAGQRAAEAVAGLLDPYATQMLAVDLGEVRHE